MTDASTEPPSGGGRGRRLLLSAVAAVVVLALGVGIVVGGRVVLDSLRGTPVGPLATERTELTGAPVTDRAGATVLWAGEEFLVLGGSEVGATQLEVTPAVQDRLRDVHAFAPDTGAWRRLADLPEGAGDELVATAADGAVYVVGYQYGAAAQARSLPVHRYDLATDTWTRLPDLPSDGLAPVEHVAVVGDVLVAGPFGAPEGAAGDPLFGDEGAALSVLDLTAGSWRTVWGPGPVHDLVAVDGDVVLVRDTHTSGGAHTWRVETVQPATLVGSGDGPVVARTVVNVPGSASGAGTVIARSDAVEFFVEQLSGGRGDLLVVHELDRSRDGDATLVEKARIRLDLDPFWAGRAGVAAVGGHAVVFDGQQAVSIGQAEDGQIRVVRVADATDRSGGPGLRMLTGVARATTPDGWTLTVAGGSAPVLDRWVVAEGD